MRNPFSKKPKVRPLSQGSAPNVVEHIKSHPLPSGVFGKSSNPLSGMGGGEAALRAADKGSPRVRACGGGRLPRRIR